MAVRRHFSTRSGSLPSMRCAIPRNGCRESPTVWLSSICLLAAQHRSSTFTRGGGRQRRLHLRQCSICTGQAPISWVRYSGWSSFTPSASRYWPSTIVALAGATEICPRKTRSTKMHERRGRGSRRGRPILRDASSTGIHSVARWRSISPRR